MKYLVVILEGIYKEILMPLFLSDIHDTVIYVLYLTEI